MTYEQAQEQSRAISERERALVAAIRSRTIAAMKQEDPNLPATGEAFHLAHNWHRCGSCKVAGTRRIVWLMDCCQRKERAVYDLCDRIRSRVWNKALGREAYPIRY